MKKLILLLAALIGGYTAVGQTTVGLEVRAGLNVSGLYLSELGDADNYPNAGINAGALFTVNFPKGFGLETGLVFSMKGNTLENVVDTRTEYRKDAQYVFRNYLEMPVHFRYRIPVSDKVTLTARVGPYVALGLYGNVKEEHTTDNPGERRHTDSKWHSLTVGTGEKDDFKPFDVGIQIGTGVEVWRFTGSVQFGYGFTDVLPQHTYGNSRNMVFSISAGYRIF
ncbi:porin family protein [Capnocytophaga haemolytica]